jgi:hypothetical protein
MTFPGGAPGGYPGQGPQQPHPGPGYGPPPGGGFKLGLPAGLHLGVAGLGLINFFVGFADAYDGGDSGFFANGSVVPTLFLLGGLFSLPAVLPGENKKPGLAPAALSVSAMLTIMFFTFSSTPKVGTGTILMLIFGILQGLLSVGVYLLDQGILKMPAPNPYGHGQPPGGMYPPSSQFPAPPPQQPGQFGQPGPPPGQATTFAPQQGQFGQPGQPPQAPGTPPGGYPQQG